MAAINGYKFEFPTCPPQVIYFFASYRSTIFLTWPPTRSKKYQFLNMVTKLNTDAGNKEILSNLNKVDCGR